MNNERIANTTDFPDAPSAETPSSFAALATEQINSQSADIDTLSSAEIAALINELDSSVSAAVSAVIPNIAKAIDASAASIMSGARLIYIGAGTSGRLGVLDAVECRPTFGVPDGVVVGLIAGGYDAMFRAVEGAEDSLTLCEKDLREIMLTPRDTVIGIAASGRTPYVIGGLRYAAETGCKTFAIACTANSEIGKIADVAIEAVTGAEVIAGSTRMKAGTAQKMILNMISTGAFIKAGKTYGNLMIDVQPTNEKLTERAVRIIRDVTGKPDDCARQLLHEAHGSVKTAVVMGLAGCSAEDAKIRLEKSNGIVRTALQSGSETV